MKVIMFNVAPHPVGIAIEIRSMGWKLKLEDVRGSAVSTNKSFMRFMQNIHN
jgi:hypothetical protein